MTPLEVVLLTWLVLSLVLMWVHARTIDHTLTERDYLRGLYSAAIAELERVTRERNYYEREWAARWDAHARDAGQPVRHIGAGE